MALLFTSPREQVTFYRNAISGKHLDSNALIESAETIRMDHADIIFRNWCFGGFRLASNQLQQQRETTYAISNTIDAIKIYFNRRGLARIDYRQLAKSFTIGSGQFNMLYSSELNSRMAHIDDHSEMFSLQITNACFQQLTGEGSIALGSFAREIEKGRPALFADNWLPMNTAMQKCIDEILYCPYSRELKQLYLRSKAVELFVLFVAAVSVASTERLPLRPDQRERLYFVRDHLVRNYADEATLAGVARLAGLNEFKLKQGFRQLFGTSVIEFLIDCRLRRARELLLEGRNVSEAAYAAGYASPGYFSKAFRKKFGVTPRDASAGSRSYP